MASKRKNRFRLIGLALLLAVSLASYTYMHCVDKAMKAQQDPVLVEELEEKKSEILPDVQLIKALMQRTMDFMSISRQF